MFKTTANDYNILKNQRDYGNMINKYKSIKLKTIPNEMQKYYKYLEEEQPKLDELNYIAEKLKEDDYEKIKKQYDYIKDLDNASKIKQSLKQSLKNDLFDLTPTVQTSRELIQTQNKNDFIQSQNKEEEEQAVIKIENSILNKIKRERAKKELENLKEEKKNKKQQEEQAVNKIENSILNKIKRERAKKELENLKIKRDEDEIRSIASTALISPTPTPAPKRRGRPRKQQENNEVKIIADDTKRRGRPRKQKND